MFTTNNSDGAFGGGKLVFSNVGADSATVANSPLIINDSGNVGIGSAPATDWHANYSVLQVGGQAGIWTHKAVGAGKALHISHNAEYDTGFKYIASDEASLYLQGDGGKHIFSTAAAGTAGNAISFATKVQIDTDGLKFNGDTAAANALDDYEEGTWTPVVSGASIAASQILGTYTKIGNRVLFQCYIYGNITSNGTTPAKITGLPFTTGANGLNQTVFHVSHNTGVDGESIGGFMSNNNTQLIFLNRNPNNVAASWINGNGKEVIVNGTYFTDS